MSTGPWRKSSHSTNHGSCAEVGVLVSDSAPGYVIGVRDSKDPGGPVLRFSGADWAAFLAAVKGTQGGPEWVAFCGRRERQLRNNPDRMDLALLPG